MKIVGRVEIVPLRETAAAPPVRHFHLLSEPGIVSKIIAGPFLPCTCLAYSSWNRLDSWGGLGLRRPTIGASPKTVRPSRTWPTQLSPRPHLRSRRLGLGVAQAAARRAARTAKLADALKSSCLGRADEQCLCLRSTSEADFCVRAFFRENFGIAPLWKSVRRIRISGTFNADYPSVQIGQASPSCPVWLVLRSLAIVGRPGEGLVPNRLMICLPTCAHHF